MIQWRKVFLLAAGLAISVGSNSRAYEKDDYNKYLSDFSAMKSAYRKVADEVQEIEQQHADTTAGTVACRTGAWAVLFKKSLEDMEAERKKLESARLDLFNYRQKTEAERVAIEKEHSQLRSKAAQLGEQYWIELENITERMRLQYIDKIKEVVIIGYRHYISAVRAAIGFVKHYQQECGKPFPGTALAKTAVENAGEIIREVTKLALEIKKVIP